MTHKLDPETGLPELPEGYFWRVNNGHDVGSLGEYPGVEVAIMKHSTKLRRFKRVPCTRVVGDMWRPRENLKPGEVAKAVAEIAQEVFKRYRGDLPVHDKVQAEIESLAGDYPPKRLEH